MAFLFQDQNQGIRNDAPRAMRLSRPFSFIRTLTVGFGITPNLLTLPLLVRKALPALCLSHLTARGAFLAGLGRNYGEWPGRQQAPSAWEIRMSLMFPARNWRNQGRIGPGKLTIRANR